MRKAPQLPPVPESRQFPTFVANTPQARVFARVYHGYPYPYRTEIEIVNSSGTRLLFSANGIEDYVPSGAVKRFKAQDYGPFASYQLTAEAATNAKEVTVYERGGLSRAD